MKNIRFPFSFAICCALFAFVQAPATAAPYAVQNPGAAVPSESPESNAASETQTARQEAAPSASAGAQEPTQTRGDEDVVPKVLDIHLLQVSPLTNERVELGPCLSASDMFNPWAAEDATRPTAEIVESQIPEGSATVSFDGRSSTDTDGTVVRWEWAFGDGTTGSGPVVSHSYAAAGAYTVELTTYDNQGKTNLIHETSKVWVTTDLAVSQSVNPYASDAGDNEVVFYVTVTNLGALPTTNVSLGFTSANSMEVISASFPAGAGWRGDVPSSYVDIARLAAGESATVTLVASFRCIWAEGCQVENSVKVECPGGDTNEENNVSVVSLTIAGPPTSAP